MSESITIAIDIPPRSLSANGRTHWAVKSGDKIAAKQTAFVLARREMLNKNIVAKWDRFTLSVMWYAARKNWVPDCDNIFSSLKATIDGVGQAGLFVNDKAMEIGRVIRSVDADSPHVVLHFERIDE